MNLHLTPLWTLTDEHSSSSYGRPVLVNRETNEGYGPGDVLKVNPSGSYVPGYLVVRGLTEDKTFSAEEIAFIDRF